ncbi:MAG: MFS transporter [Candidatus Latescibacterota bacterium]
MNDSGNTENTAEENVGSKGIPNPITEIITAFRALKGAPKGFWYTNYAYWLDGISYFGMLTLLAMFFHDVVGLSDDTGHKIVSIYTGLITGTMLIFGPISDKLGVRRSLLISVILYIFGRSALPLAVMFLPAGSTLIVVVCIIALAIAAAGNGFMQPSCYAGVRKFADKNTAAMGYGLLYAGMNMGIVIIGLISPRIRTGLHLKGIIDFDGFGIVGVFWFCVFVNVLMLLGLLFRFTRKVEREAVQSGEEASGTAKQPSAPGRQFSKNPLGATSDWFKGSPVSNPRFMFFIFALLPVQTLFAYQWLVMPQFVTRAFSDAVANNMESIVNVANPLIIVLGVPVITALTRKVPVYRMMIIGSLVSALPTFFFCLGPNFYLLMTYIILFSFGEALWQPRFLQYASELAPEGKTGAYVAFANIPWFMIKFMAGWYTGSMMERYCPDEGALQTETMWLIYGLIAITSPLLLIIAKPWVQKGKGLETKSS